jgi:hypothetical protein
VSEKLPRIITETDERGRVHLVVDAYGRRIERAADDAEYVDRLRVLGVRPDMRLLMLARRAEACRAVREGTATEWRRAYR